MMLCTLDTLKTYLGITDESQNDLLTLIIKQSSSQIENYIGYSLSRAENVEEVHNVNNEQLLILDNQPIQEVSAVTIGGEEITDFKIIPKYANQGVLYRGLGWCGNYYTRGMTHDIVSGVYEIKVSYISGYYLPTDEDYTEGAKDSLPYEIMSACLMASAEAFNVKMNNAEGIKSYSEGGISTTFAVGEGKSDCGLSAKVCSMLEDYKRQVVA